MWRVERGQGCCGTGKSGIVVQGYFVHDVVCTVVGPGIIATGATHQGTKVGHHMCATVCKRVKQTDGGKKDEGDLASEHRRLLREHEL